MDDRLSIVDSGGSRLLDSVTDAVFWFIVTTIFNCELFNTVDAQKLD